MKNLRLIFERADKSGLNWYAEANQFCTQVSERYGIPVEKVCAVVSSLSPGTDWARNQKDTVNLIESLKGNRAQFKFGTYGANVLKAYKILDGTVAFNEAFNPKTGPKTYNFFFNVWQPSNPEYVTIDRHAYRIATGNEYKALTPKQYQEVANHYKRAADKIGILPNQLQSTLWVDYRVKQFTGTAYEHLL